MQTATRTQAETAQFSVQKSTAAAVYYGREDVGLETVPVPKIGPGELLVRVHTCGICGTDLKKIATGSHSAPRIFGHETSGRVVAVGEGVSTFKLPDRPMPFPPLPPPHCYHSPPAASP